MNCVWAVKNGTVNVKPQSAGRHHRISCLLVFLFPVGSWSVAEFKIENSQEVTLSWMKDGWMMMELNGSNRVDIMTGVVPKRSACSVFPLFLQAQLLLAPFSTCLAHSLGWVLVCLQPASAFIMLSNLAKTYLPFLLGQFLLGCPGSANCQMSSSSWVCAIGGGRRRKLHCHSE